MKKTIKWVFLVGVALGVLLISFMLGYADGIFTGTARGAMIGCFQIIPTAHAIHLKPIPRVIDLLDRDIEFIVLELKPLQRHLGRSDLKLLGDLKALLQKYSQDHPKAIKNTEVIQWVHG